MVDRPHTSFEEFVTCSQAALARSFAAAYGPERGQDALAAAMAYAWEHFDRLEQMANPVGYLYRVGQSQVRRSRVPVAFPSPTTLGMRDVEPGLPRALAKLSERQRVCVVLLHAYEWTYQEVADLLGVSRSSVETHERRGMARLREALGMVVDG